MPARLLLVAAAWVSLISPSSAQTGPAFAFTSLADPDAVKVVSRYFNERDYISVLVAQRIPELGARIPQSQQYKMVESLPKLDSFLAKGCQENQPGILIYDIEKWDATPQEEQGDPFASINKAAENSRRQGCQAFGIAPSRAYLSTPGGACVAQPGPAIERINWERIDVLVIQVQGMLRESCYERYRIQNYEKFIETISRYGHSRNPHLKVFAELSFRYSSAAQMSEIIDRVGSKVTGYYLALPSGRDDCRFCSVGELESLLSRYRHPTAGLPR